MKLKHILQITLIFLFSLITVNSALALRVIGENPFYKGSMASPEEIRTMIQTHQADIKKGLGLAGDPQLFEPLIDQIGDADIKEVEYQKGQVFEWMFFRKKGKGTVRVDKKLVWESNTPVKGFEFFIDYDGVRYTLTVPPKCGNLALLGEKPVPAPIIVPPPVAPPVTPPADSMGGAGAGNPGSGAGPQEKPETPLAADPPAAPMMKKTAFPFIIDTAYMHQFDPAHHFLIRMGSEYAFNENFSIIGMIGGAPKYDGLEGESAFIADIFANYSFSRYFVGFGVGAWITDGDSDIDHEDSGTDLILNFGARILGEPDGPNTSLFVEFRSAVDELDEYDLYGRAGAGFRFRF